MKIIIHIGMPKAASTSIQNFCVLNSEVLKKYGVVVPMFLESNLGHRMVVYDVFDFEGFSQIRRYDNWRNTKKWMINIEQIYADACGSKEFGTLFLSSEAFDSYAADANRFNKLLDWLDSFACEVEFVAVIRDQASFANSLYCQRAKALNTVCNFDEATPIILEKDTLNFRKRYNALFKTKQKLIAVPFSNLVKEGIDRYLIRKVFGIEETDIYNELQPPIRRNANPGAKTVAAGLKIRSRIEEKLNREKFPEQVRHRLKRNFVDMTSDLGWQATAFCGLDDTKASAIMKSFAKQNDAFARLVWGADWNDVYALPSFVEREFVLSEASRAEQDEFRGVVQCMDERFDQLLHKYREGPQPPRNQVRAARRKRRNQGRILHESLD